MTTSVLGACLVGGLLYQFGTTRLDERKFFPAGQLVDVGGRKMHINCTGNGSPTVILESGLGGGSLDWSLVQPEVAKFARVCSYDRAGIAWSDPAGDVRDAAHVTDDLHNLLTAANVAPPYVLVGHSIGGIYVQLFASKYPDEVMGAVLVDSSHPDQLSRYPGIPAWMPLLYKVASPFGVARIVNNSGKRAPNLSPEIDAERTAVYSHTGTVYAIADEMSAIPESLAEVNNASVNLGTKPLVVLAHGLSDGGSIADEAVWRDLQTDLSKRSANGKLVIAANSGHYIQFFEPNLVVDAIHQVVSLTVENLARLPPSH